MEIRPGHGVGPLEFGWERERVQAVLGPPTQVMHYDADRTALSFGGDVDVLLHARLGLVAVTLYRGPALILGVDAFACAPAELEARLRARGPASWRGQGGDEPVLSAPGLGLLFYFDDDGPEGRALSSVEAYTGRWRRGQPGTGTPDT